MRVVVGLMGLGGGIEGTLDVVHNEFNLFRKIIYLFGVMWCGYLRGLFRKNSYEKLGYRV